MPEWLFDRVLAAGQLIMYTAGDVIWRPNGGTGGSKPASDGGEPDSAAGGKPGSGGAGTWTERSPGGVYSSTNGRGSQGVFVVLHGIVRSAYAAPDGTTSVSS